MIRDDELLEEAGKLKTICDETLFRFWKEVQSELTNIEDERRALREQLRRELEAVKVQRVQHNLGM